MLAELKEFTETRSSRSSAPKKKNIMDESMSAIFEACLRIRPTSSARVEHVAPAPVVEHVAPAPVVEHRAPAPVVEHLAPAPEVEHLAPAPVVKYIAPAPEVVHIAQAPKAKHIAPAPEVEHIAQAIMQTWSRVAGVEEGARDRGALSTTSYWREPSSRVRPRAAQTHWRRGFRGRQIYARPPQKKDVANSVILVHPHASPRSPVTSTGRRRLDVA